MVIRKKLIVLFLALLSTQCSNDSSDVNCDTVDKKSANFLYQYYIHNNHQDLDSALFYTNLGINSCSTSRNKLSLRKLSILAEQQLFKEAINFIETFDNEMFSDLPYYQELLLNRFKVMEAIHENNRVAKEIYLDKCVTIIAKYLSANKESADSLIRQSSFEKILRNPLGTALTQYYYYKSITDIESVKKELIDKKNDQLVNREFIEYLIYYLESDIMVFEGF